MAPKFFVGTTGLDANGACSYPSVANGDGTCNTCQDVIGTAGGPTACNQRAILPGQSFSITLSSDQAVATIPTIVVTSATGSTTVPTVVFPAPNPSTTSGANQPVTFTFSWSQICGLIVPESGISSPNCLNDGVVKLQFIFSTTPGTGGQPSGDSLIVPFIIQNSSCPTVTSILGTPTCTGTAVGTDGIDSFDLKGKKKMAHIAGVTSVNASFPLLSSRAIRFTTARFFYVPVPSHNSSSPAENGCAMINTIRNSTSTYIDNPIVPYAHSGPSRTFAKENLTGLKRKTAYAFKIALVDQAGNVGYFTADQNCGDRQANGNTPYGNHVVRIK